MSEPHPLFEATKAALKGWRTRSIPRSPFEALQLYQQQLQARSESTAHPYEATVAVLKLGLKELARYAEVSAAFLHDHFELQLTMKQLTRRYSQSESSLYKLQNAAIAALAEIIAYVEARLTAPLQQQLAVRLPQPTYTRLVGVQGHLDRLSAILAGAQEPSWVVISGIGGIGKTALADAVTRRVVGDGHFGGVGWVSAQQVLFTLKGELQPSGLPTLTPERLLESLTEQLTGIANVRSRTSVNEAYALLTGRLRETRHLIVIDNFETAVDIERLLHWLKPLVNPAKILLTSRVHPLEAGDLYPYPLRELERDDAVTLLAQEASARNFDALSEDERLLTTIYEVVGGNPLALRLVVAQAYLYGVATELEDVARGRHKGELLYRYIFQSVWGRLDEGARLVLLAMPLMPESGGTLDTLAGTSGLSLDELRAPLAHLIGQNLVNVYGAAQKRLYTIHNLTRAYLKEAIIKW